MKISVTYLVPILRYGYPPKMDEEFRSFEYIHKLGFRYLEMEGLGAEHSANLIKNLPLYKKALADADVHVHNFCCVNKDLVSLDRAKRDKAVEYFKKTAEIGCELGAETIHLASYTPPVEYVGRSPYQLDGGSYEFSSTTTMHIPDGFDWEQVWDAVVDSTRRCAEYAQSVGKTVIMEPRVNEIICSVDSMRRLIDDVGSSYLKANFDMGHFSAQRENVCLALAKLKGRYANIHVADNDPQNTDHLAVGDGLIDWKEFFHILKQQGYDGYLGLDFGAKDDQELEKRLLISRDRLAEYAKAEGITLDW